MGFSDALTHTCAISRATVTADPLGGKVKTWAIASAGVACRLVERGERAWSDARAAFVTGTSYTLLVGAGADIVPGDRVTVTLEDGMAVTGFEVKSVLARRGAGGVLHHCSATLDVVA